MKASGVSSEKMMLSRQLIDGKLQEPKEGCIYVALKSYKQRYLTDPNPAVVQMTLRGLKLDHFYYRSDIWIEQTFYYPLSNILHYVGPADKADAVLYGPGTFSLDNIVNNNLPQKLELFLIFFEKNDKLIFAKAREIVFGKEK